MKPRQEADEMQNNQRMYVGDFPEDQSDPARQPRPCRSRLVCFHSKVQVEVEVEGGRTIAVLLPTCLSGLPLPYFLK